MRVIPLLILGLALTVKGGAMLSGTMSNFESVIASGTSNLSPSPRFFSPRINPDTKFNICRYCSNISPLS